MAGGESSGERGAWEAASTVFRIAKVGLSLASAVMTATSKQCAFRPDGGGLAGAASYSDYGSLQYAALANLLSAVLQGVAIFLEAVGKGRWAKAVELVDKLALALTSTSAPLLLALDDIASCGPPRGGGGSRAARRRQRTGFGNKLELASYANLSTVVLAAGNEVVKKLKR
ncbi:CASP-like protein 1U3 [Panicum hallii]|uniref:CASP-like protein 1U3 n=1 Tax=Panicum hallii TaxID=206008 RepID=UPI000DF4D9C6|nr:CASP-like protein 1U3 [Panicum hallii]